MQTIQKSEDDSECVVPNLNHSRTKAFRDAYEKLERDDKCNYPYVDARNIRKAEIKARGEAAAARRARQSTMFRNPRSAGHSFEEMYRSLQQQFKGLKIEGEIVKEKNEKLEKENKVEKEEKNKALAEAEKGKQMIADLQRQLEVAKQALTRSEDPSPGSKRPRAH
jgi:hypothetical protein